MVGDGGIDWGGVQIIQRRWSPAEWRGHLCRPIRARLRVTHSCHIWGDEGGARDLRSV